jgi:hypothetical protein
MNLKLMAIFIIASLSFDVQAEQYVCVEEEGAMVSTSGINEFAADGKDTYIIDTESGFKRLQEQDYSGQCTIENADLQGSEEILCTTDAERLWIANNLSFTLVWQSFSAAIMASVGTCTRL